MRRRSDERSATAGEEAIPVRTERFFQQDGGWYFKTREGIPVGPYTDVFDAELSASLLITRLAQLEAHEDPRIAIAKFQDDPAVGPLAQQMSTISKEELNSLLSNCRRERRLPTFRKAWRAVSRYLPATPAP
ncbi:MAG: DUF6316 family protein [Pseudomonadota bacterium]